MMLKIFRLLACLLPCLQLSYSQLADDSVRESSYYQQKFDPTVTIKYDLNSYFTVMNFVEKNSQTAASRLNNDESSNFF